MDHSAFFVIFYQVIGFTLVLDLIGYAKASVLRILGISFIGQQNIVRVFQNPLTVLLLICVASVLIFYVYLEVAALFLYCEAGWRGEKVTLWQLWKTAFLRALALFHVGNLPVGLVMVPLIGFSIFPMSYGFLSKIRIPEFILDFIHGSPVLSVLLAASLLLINVLAFFYLFSLPDLMIGETRRRGSLRAASRLIKGRVWKTAAALLGCLLAFLLLAAAVSGAGIALLWGWSKLAPSADGGKSVFRFMLVRAGGIGSILFGMLLPVSLYSAVITLYHQYRGDTAPQAEKSDRTPGRILFRAAAVLGCLVFTAFFSETELGGNLYSAYSPGMEVVAHRAGAAFAPENTLAALEDSIEAGAEMAEIDVQQTRDGVLIVLHDSNFLRTTGWNQAVWESDYAAVRTLDAGSFFSHTFAGELIPTLEEMLHAARGRIRLMIELKSTGHEHELVEKTVEQIKAAGMEAACVVASMDGALLQKSKDLAPEIETVYITSLAFSQQYDLDYVDGYSVETSFLTLEMITQIQYLGKKIYAWTANTDSNIKKIIRLGADGLVTDNPRLAGFFLTFYDKNYVVDGLADLLYA